MIEDKFVLDTPENVHVDFEIAGIGSRFFAVLIDQIWLFVARLLLGMLGFAIYNASDFDDETGILVLTLGTVLIFITGWFYFIFFEISWNGQTPGKRYMGLRVIKTNGLPLSASEAAIRNLLRIVDSLPSLYGAGLVTMFFQPQSRRLGDLAAGTLVVFEQTEVSLDRVKDREWIDLSHVVMSEQVLDLPVEKISASLHYMAEDFLTRLRKDQMASSGKMVARQMLSSLYTQMNLTNEAVHVSESSLIPYISQICLRLRQMEKSEE